MIEMDVLISLRRLDKLNLRYGDKLGIDLQDSMMQYEINANIKLCWSDVLTRP